MPRSDEKPKSGGARKTVNAPPIAPKEDEEMYEAEGILGRRGVNKYFDEVLVKWAGFHS